MKNDLRILVVNEDCYEWGMKELYKPRLSEMAERVERTISGEEVVRRINPLDYNVALIDASDNCIHKIEQIGSSESHSYYSLTDFLRSRNPDMIIIGTSILGEKFRKDELSEREYDEKISIGDIKEFPEQVKEILIKYGFEFKK